MTPCGSYACATPLSRSEMHVSIAASRALVLILALIIRELLSAGSLADAHGLVAYTLLLLAYLGIELCNLRRRDARLFWLNPVVLGSVLMFVLAFGVTNILYFLPEDVVNRVGLEPIATPWMNQLMLLVMLGACAMWVGYTSAAGRSLGQTIGRARFLRKLLLPSASVNKVAVFVCIAISLAARLMAIRLGVYGYSSTYDRLIEAAQYTQYLAMAQSLGQLALVVLAIQCFASPRPLSSDKWMLWLVVASEVFFGFLSGFKSAVVMPFVIVAIVHYAVRRRFPKWIVPAVVAGVLASYAVIEPFRGARNEDPGFSGRSIGSIVSTMASAVGAGAAGPAAGAIKTDEGTPLWLNFAVRHNLTYIASLGIEYAAADELPAESPEFLRDILLAPFHAVIPRFVWTSKPLQNIGLWYTNEVRGLDLYSSTGMSPFTYLNFAGGPLAVVLGFLAVGILQRGLFDGLQCFGTGGLIVFLGLLGTLASVDSAVNTFLVGLIRFFPVLVVAQFLLLRRSCPST